ncbi:MAG: TetR/AcrR family transcriptional regulator [bacterium]|nr:TetR/AcrR family transcriptional regulator [bacterium]
MAEIKSSDERRKEIIGAARQLFIDKGYDATSTTDIMKAVGIAKGTLYYHFSSKEEILDALIETITDDMVLRARKVASEMSVPVVTRMVGVIKSLRVASNGDADIVETIHLPQNALLHQKSHTETIHKICPMMLELVNEGIANGIFHTEYPKAAVHMALTYSVVGFDDPSVLDMDIIQGFVYNLERLLGTEPGCLNQFFELFCQ